MAFLAKQIRAIRVVEEDKLESALLNNGLRDEEVFLAQLHRRSRLLNQVRDSSVQDPSSQKELHLITVKLKLRLPGELIIASTQTCMADWRRRVLIVFSCSIAGLFGGSDSSIT